MKIAYIAHPVSGDVSGNIAKIIQICRTVNLEEPDVVPLVPYLSDLYALDDNDILERQRGIENDIAVIKSGIIKEVRLYGDKISKGMKAECDLAILLGIEIRPMTPETRANYSELYP